MKNLILQRSGQIAVEFILIMVVVAGIAAFVASEIRSRETLALLISKPWSRLTGVIENGVWGEAAKTKEQHPNMLYRHVSLQGDRL